jgi:hypothetical protein
MSDDDKLTWTVRKSKGVTFVVFKGTLDESADFSALATLAGEVTFDLAGVSRINSEGIRRWIVFMQGVEGIERLKLVRCSVAVVEQLNMIRGVEGSAEVVSFYAPYINTENGDEELKLLHISQVPDPLKPPVFPCPTGGDLVLDDIPERYLHFLTHVSDGEPQ